ncbi:hypothetical protein CEXT_776521 [Caerostris extrusa]|uniref:Uncharacterized protein n=1 Tax=Caerostris extrusa TaxID=172846 RepID=A0AAV4QG03_CAEEX|nr:hypothetical protein CEXT_776521 [Caerostris extrusa]
MGDKNLFPLSPERFVSQSAELPCSGDSRLNRRAILNRFSNTDLSPYDLEKTNPMESHKWFVSQSAELPFRGGLLAESEGNLKPFSNADLPPPTT